LLIKLQQKIDLDWKQQASGLGTFVTSASRHELSMNNASTNSYSYEVFLRKRKTATKQIF
jgi:hypothetical protein